MTDERKRKLINYLFPTEQVRKFLCNDLYKEFESLIPRTLCISYHNMTKKIREENYKKVLSLIENFFVQNNFYKNETLELYNQKCLSKEFFEDMLIGYVFYLSYKMNNFYRFDIFKDKKSICFTPISVIDVI